jgi:uncharacterized protein (DUF433 family)
MNLYNNQRKMPEDRIIVDSEVAHGKPVIKGSRVPVEIVLGSLAGGMEINDNDVAEKYGLERKDVLAAFRYAAKIVAEKIFALMPVLNMKMDNSVHDAKTRRLRFRKSADDGLQVQGSDHRQSI